jgi:hypothetical protein
MAEDPNRMIHSAIDAIIESLYAIGFFRFLFRGYHTCLGALYLVRRDYYRSLRACCRVKRLLDDLSPSALVERLYQTIFSRHILQNGKLVLLGSNAVLRSFRKSARSRHLREEFAGYGTDHAVSLKYPRKDDFPQRQGNLVIVKKYDPENKEKGVLYLKFNESLEQFASLFDIERIGAFYRVVLEPSTWGYMEEPFHLFIGSDLDVVVQAQDELDYRAIQGMNANLVPIRLGAGDWIDTDVFGPKINVEKEYDVIMIASWAKLKRHELLFRAMADAGLRDCRLALVGYPWGGRTVTDIKKEAAQFGVLQQITFYENIAPSMVSELLSRSKASVMLTRREGANRALYESLLNGVPVIVCRHNRGVNKNIVNEKTGCLANDEELGKVLKHIIGNYDKYDSVAEWARENVGYKIAKQRLDAVLRSLAEKRGETYLKPICAIKAGHAAYVSEDDRTGMAEEYEALKAFLVLSPGGR